MTRTTVDARSVLGRHALGYGSHDHWMIVGDVRRRQAEFVADGIHRLWTAAGRAVGRLARSPGLTRGTAPRTGTDRPRYSANAAIARTLHRGLKRLGGTLRHRVIEPLARRRRHERTLDHLRTLDDRILADIGLTRDRLAHLDAAAIRPAPPLPRLPRSTGARPVRRADEPTTHRIAPRTDGRNRRICAVGHPGPAAGRMAA